jgi:hypothetical protein
LKITKKPKKNKKKHPLTQVKGKQLQWYFSNYIVKKIKNQERPLPPDYFLFLFLKGILII